MPPRRTQQQQQAEDAARKLHTILQSRQVVQLLQQPPAAQLTEQQVTHLSSCLKHMQRLLDALPSNAETAETADAGQKVAAVLQKHKACYSAGMLIVWLLGVPTQPQRQQHLPLDFLLQEDATGIALAIMWHKASMIVRTMCAAIQEIKPRAAAGEAAVLFLEQLEQAGELLAAVFGQGE
jgi:hypothetical protein